MTQASTNNDQAPESVAASLEMQGIPRGSYRFSPHGAVRKLIAKRMTDSLYTAPHFSVDIRIEVDALLAMRESMNADPAHHVSLNDCFIKASAEALTRCPQVNVTFTDTGMIQHHHADVSFAVAMDGGLITPIVRDAAGKSLLDISHEARDLVERARNKRLKPEEYFGGTFSVSNLGMFGVSRFDAIINQPQAAILSLGAPAAEFLPGHAGPREARIINVTLTSDHRAIDGATAAQWLQQFKLLLEDPTWMAPAAG